MRLVLTLILMSPLVASAKPAKSGETRAKDALMTARESKDAKKEQTYLTIDESSLQDGADVSAIYEELEKLSAEGKSADRERNVKAADHLSSVLAKARKPKHHAAVRALLEKENSESGHWRMDALKAKSSGDSDRLSMRMARLYALTEAAGLGQNMQALPILRAMRKKGGEPGKMAETAIAQIGRDEDLDEFVEEIKRDPKSLINIDAFGPKGYRRVIKELNDPSTSADEKIRVAGRFPKAVSREHLPETLALLKHENPRIIMIAADTVRNSVAAEDSGLIREMLASQNSSIRDSGLLAIDRLWDAKFIPDAMKVLKHGDGWAQARAAYMLGKHRVKESESVLREVANNPDAPDGVRAAAKRALEDLEK